MFGFTTNFVFFKYEQVCKKGIWLELNWKQDFIYFLSNDDYSKLQSPLGTNHNELKNPQNWE